MENERLKIALLPLDMAWGDVAENLVSAAVMLRHVDPDTDLVVLPEMFSTGFITEPTLLAAIDEECTRHTLDDIHRWANHFGMAICGTIAVKEGGKYFNRAFFVEPFGDETFYDKRHLFSMGGEARTYTAGATPSPIIRYRGCNIKMLVCYDLRFPAWARNRDCCYDLLIYPANWPDARHKAWHTLLQARAIENQAYVAGCNRSGSDDFGTYAIDHTYIFNDWGDDIGRRNDHGIVHATIDLDALRHHRRKFPTWRDADSFTIDV